MVAARHAQDEIITESDELPAFERLLTLVERAESGELNLKIMSSGGDEIELPDSILSLLRSGLEGFMHDGAVSLQAPPRDIEIEEAASKIGIALRLLNTMIDRGKLHSVERDGRRYIPFIEFIKLFRSHRSLEVLSQQGQEFEPQLTRRPLD